MSQHKQLLYKEVEFYCIFVALKITLKHEFAKYAKIWNLKSFHKLLFSFNRDVRPCTFGAHMSGSIANYH